MPLYLFEKQNGQEVEFLYSMKDVPKEVVLQDGTIAKRKLSVPYIAGSPQTKQRIKKQQTQKNIDAGNRGRSYWKKQFQGV